MGRTRTVDDGVHRAGAIRAVGGAWLVLAALGSCSDPRTHILIANQYDPLNNCFNPSAGVDVVDGPLPAVPCQPTCLTDPNANVYVTTTCGPYPPLDTVETGDTDGGTPCAGALAAWSQALACGAGTDDGGGGDSSCPDASAGSLGCGDDGGGGDGDQDAPSPEGGAADGS